MVVFRVRILEKIRSTIVLFLLRISDRNFVSKEDVEYSGQRSEVFFYRAEDTWEIGKTIGGLAIGLNKSTLEDYPQVMKKYTFLHEKGHKDSFVGWKIFYYPLAFLSAMALIVSALGLLILILSLLLPIEPGLTLSDILVIVGFYLHLFVSLKWIDEGYAEIKAFRYLAQEEREEVKEHLKRENRLDWLLMRFYYPPISWVEFIVDRLYQD